MAIFKRKHLHFVIYKRKKRTWPSITSQSMWAPLAHSLPSFPLFVPMPQKYSFKAANTIVCMVLIKRKFFSYDKSNQPVWHFVHKQKAINLILDIFWNFPKPINLTLDSFQNFPKPHHKRSDFFNHVFQSMIRAQDLLTLNSTTPLWKEMSPSFWTFMSST
jgi:hypothetical protein